MLLSIDTITTKRVVRRIPVTCLEEIIIDAKDGLDYMMKQLEVVFCNDTTWINSRPYIVTVVGGKK